MSGTEVEVCFYTLNQITRQRIKGTIQDTSDPIFCKHIYQFVDTFRRVSNGELCLYFTFFYENEND